MMCLFLAGEAHADGWELACPNDIKHLPHLDSGTLPIEPSGVAWDPVNQVAVGVSDEASSYALFVFDPGSAGASKGKGKIPVQPLLTKSLVEQYQPADLEGITRLPDGQFVASASHGLTKKNERDTVLRFRLRKRADGNWELFGLQRIVPVGQGFRAWLTSAANPPWDKKFATLKNEEGINAEGLAASGLDDRLFLGFRGPIVKSGIPVFSFRVDASGHPVAGQWYLPKVDKRFDVGGMLGFGKENLGIRDFTPVVGSNAFLMLIGASGSGSDIPFQVGWWEEGRPEIQVVGKLPAGFRAEGITILAASPDSYRILLVSDKDAMVTECQATRK